MDELKRYFRQHEVEMQVEIPDEKRMWESFESQWQKRRQSKRVIKFIMPYAAAACVLLFIGLAIKYLIIEDSKGVEQKEIAKNRVPVIQDGGIIKDTTSNMTQAVAATQVEKKRKQSVKTKLLKENQLITDDYAQLIHYQLQHLRSTPVYAESPGYFTEFRQQLQQMDTDEDLLKKDIQLYGLNDRLLETFINIYQRKLSLLKCLQVEINKMNNTIREKKSAGELHAYYLNI